jgi:hypothetical protein
LFGFSMVKLSSFSFSINQEDLLVEGQRHGSSGRMPA